MKLGKNNNKFVNQLCKTLPSNPDHNDQPIIDMISSTVQEAKEDLEEFEEEERHFKMEQAEELERERKYGYKEPVARMIGQVRVGALDIYYKRYQRDGTLIVKPELQHLYDTDVTIQQEYDELIKNGLFHGDVVWEK